MAHDSNEPESTQSDTAFLRSVLDALPSHVAVLDEDGVVVEVNARWRAFGVENEGDPELLGPGVNYLEVCEKAAENEADGALDIAKGIRQVIAGERDSYYMCYPCHSPEQQRWFQLRVHPCPDQDPVRVVVAHESITEAQEIERLSRRQQSDLAHVMRLGTINEMATGLAHELNQPLATISNFASGCLRRIESSRDDPEAIKEALSTIVSESQRAGEILRRVRQFVRKGHTLDTRFALDDVIKDATALIASEANLADIKIVHLFDEPVVESEGDPVQVQQVIVNIMRNAIEAIRDADTELAARNVYVRTARDMPNMARINIIDTGPGIPREQINHIFDPFYTTKVSGDDLPENGEGGMGLGLSLCRSIIDAHSGDLRADRNRFGGLTFTITLPLQRG